MSSAQRHRSALNHANALGRLRLAWVAWAIALVLTGFGLGLLALSYRTPVAMDFGFRGYPAILAIAYSTVGAIVASHRPDHRIGWLFCAAGLLAGLLTFLSEYAIVALVAWPDTLPGGLMAAWIGSWIWVPMTGLISTFLLLLFPTGRLLSPRWRPVGWLGAAWVALLSLQFAFSPGPMWNFSFANNPFGIEAVGGVPGQAATIPALLAIGCGFLSAAAVIVRFRRSRSDERQQLKWFAYAAALLVLFIPPAIVSVAIPLVLASQVGIPIAAGIAILKYRLYDIDFIIRRTLAYGALTVALGLIYFGIVALLQSTFSGLIEEANQLTIVVSTLAIAALFRPLRHRIQGVIDRRFYRRKYNTELVLAAFSAILREEMDLDRLSAALLAVVEETVQPAHVSLWFRQDDARAGERQTRPDSKR